MFDSQFRFQSRRFYMCIPSESVSLLVKIKRKISLMLSGHKSHVTEQLLRCQNIGEVC
jgi:hypothetical protein